MKCEICGANLSRSQARCPDCGWRFQSADAAPVYSEKPKRPKVDERKGCCCALVVLLPFFGFLIAVIIAVFSMLADFDMHFDFEFATPEPAAPPYSQPYQESQPKAASEDCFSITVKGALRFLPERWDGSSILVVPDTVDGHTVLSLAPGCFKNCTELTTITLPETLTEISPEAFAGCSKLRGLFIPQSVHAIGADAFAGCTSLEAIHIPGTMESIEPGCFDDCARLIFIFYDGAYEQWRALYNDYITPHTTAICHDGNYYHGVQD